MAAAPRRQRAIGSKHSGIYCAVEAPIPQEEETMPVSLVCGKCRAKNLSENKICDFCGTPLTYDAGVSTVVEEPPMTPPRGPLFYETLRGAFLISVGIIALTFAAFVLSNFLIPNWDLKAKASFYDTLGESCVVVLALYWSWFLFFRERSSKRQVKR